MSSAPARPQASSGRGHTLNVHVVVEKIMAHKLPDLALRLAALGKPTFVNGRWRKPPLSRRQLADVRKILILQGADIPLKPLRNRGGDKPLKLRKWERNKESRHVTTK